jgi:hypothetical protein
MERTRGTCKEIDTIVNVKKERRGRNNKKDEAEVYLHIQLVVLTSDTRRGCIYLVQNYI